MSTPIVTSLETGQISAQSGLGEYFDHQPGEEDIAVVSLEGEDPMFTRHPKALGLERIKVHDFDPLPDAIAVTKLEKDDNVIVAGSDQSVAYSLITEYPSASEFDDSGSEHEDDQSDSEDDSLADSEPEMTEVYPDLGPEAALDPALDSEDERAKQDLQIHLLAAKIHDSLKEEKKLNGLTPEEEEMMRKLEESDSFVSGSGLGSDFTSIPDSGGSVGVDSSDAHTASPPLSSPGQSDQAYFIPESLMPASILPTTTTDTSPPTRGLSPPLFTQSAQDIWAPTGGSSQSDSMTKRLEAIDELDSGLNSDPLSPSEHESDKQFKDRLDGI